MAGGDLRSAIHRDLRESEGGGKRLLSWYGRGRGVLLGVARGLAYLHAQQACAQQKSMMRSAADCRLLSSC